MSDTADVVVVGLGALGSATAAALAARGARVVGCEQFALGHERGASHDSSRILRHSYHTPGYVELTREAYADWAVLEEDTGEQLVTVTGGVDLFPAGAAIAMTDYTTSMDAVGIGHEVLEADEVVARWPAFALPAGTQALYQERTAIVPAARGTAAAQRLARSRGAQLREHTAVRELRPGAGGVDVVTDDGVLSAGAVVVTADAWTAALLAPLGHDLPLTVTEEQLTYLAPADPAAFAPGVLPVWIWMDDPSFYGFPCYGEPTVKVAQDCGGPVVTAQRRSGVVDPGMLARLTAFAAGLLPGSGPPVRAKRCLYTLTPDRDFVLGALPADPRVVVGLGAAHGFKFTPTFGRRLADLALGAVAGPELHPFRLDRPALTDPAYAGSWLV